MKLLLIAVICLSSSIVLAKGKKGGKSFEEIKTKVTERIAKRKANIASFETCVNAAASKEDLKKCRKENKKRNQSMFKNRKHKKNK